MIESTQAQPDARHEVERALSRNVGGILSRAREHCPRAGVKPRGFCTDGACPYLRELLITFKTEASCQSSMCARRAGIIVAPTQLVSNACRIAISSERAVPEDRLAEFQFALHSEDAQFATALAFGCDTAWSRLLSRMKVLASQQLRRRRVQRCAQDEIVAEAVFDLYTRGGLARFRPKTPLDSWLRGVLENVLRRHVREQHRKTDPQRVLVSRPVDPLAFAGHNEERQRLNDATARLPVADRRILELRYVDNRTFGYIARALHMTYPMQASRALDVAIDRLRQLLSCVDTASGP